MFVTARDCNEVYRKASGRNNITTEPEPKKNAGCNPWLYYAEIAIELDGNMLESRSTKAISTLCFS